MGLTLAQRCGANATLNDSDPTDKTITIHLNDFVSGDPKDLDAATVTAITAANVNNYVEKIFGALVKFNRKNQPANATTDETIGVVIDDGVFRITFARGNTQIVKIYGLNFYEPYAGSTDVDPDNLVG